MGLRDRLLGDPSGLDDRGARRALRHGSSTLRIGVVLALARRGVADPALLQDAVPGVRRAVARGLGWLGDPACVPALRAAIERERSDTVRIAVAGALLRCGDTEFAITAVRRAARRALRTVHGTRRPTTVTGHGPTEAERAAWREVGRIDPGPLTPRDQLIDELLASLDADPHGPDAAERLARLAPLCPPGLDGKLRAWEEAGGRRSVHVFLEALGGLGDPATMPRLVGALRATDADPGRGFAHRRIAATAVGRIGDPAALGEILGALDREALEFEGRPGAGLGIQYPVRNVLIWALGELGAAKATRTLAGYLENVHGSPTGGFHLPAMDALAKLGPAARPILEPLAAGPEVLAANARGVLEVLDTWPASPIELLNDPDPRARSGVDLLFARRWFDAHEALEAAWREATGERRVFLQALIQVAVSYEHLRRGNPRGALGQWTKAREKLTRLPAAYGGLDLEAFRADVDRFCAEIALQERARAARAGDLPSEETWPLPTGA